MELRNRKNGVAYYGSLSVEYASRIFRKTLIASIIIGIFGLLVCVLIAGEIRHNWVYKTKYAQAFNSCTLEERRTMAEKGLLQYRVAGVNGSYFIVIEDEPLPAGDFFAKIWCKYILWALLISVLIAMVRTFHYYSTSMGKNRFYADFPGTKAERRLLLGLTLIYFPVYLVSYCRIQQWKKKEAAKYDTNGYKYYEATSVSLGSQVFPNDIALMAEDYGRFRQEIWQSDYLAQTERLETDIKNARDAVERTGDVHAKAQAELEEFEARYAEVTASPPTPLRFGETELEDDLREISRMRGVTDVRVWHRATLETVISIDLKVRIPYNGELYMAGDYTIFLSSGGGRLWTIQRNNCGLVDGYDIHPHYYYPNQKTFCFGTRENEIKAHLKAGEVVAAVGLMIDSMHSVAKKDQPYIPRCYRRVVQVKIL